MSIAADNRTSISADELLLLLPAGSFASSEGLIDFLSSDSFLKRELTVAGRELVRKGFEELAYRRADHVQQTIRRICSARSFAHRLNQLCPWLRLVALSGSVAYGSSEAADDVDFFIITRKDRLWVTLLFAMLVAKVMRARDPAAPIYCLNRAIEEERAMETFRTVQDPLFAREALNLRVLVGNTYYHELVHTASWMYDMFPALYRRALKVPTRGSDISGNLHRPLWSIANWLALTCLGPYLAIMGMWRNANQEKKGNFMARFRTVVHRRFFAYESRKYDFLRNTYWQAF